MIGLFFSSGRVLEGLTLRGHYIEQHLESQSDPMGSSSLPLLSSEYMFGQPLATFRLLLPLPKIRHGVLVAWVDSQLIFLELLDS